MAIYNSLQDVFDTVWQKFVVEKAPQSRVEFANGDSRCCYRGPNGSCCFFGACIPDDKYDPSFEGRSASYLAEHIEQIFLPALTEAYEGQRSLNELQIIHDTADPKNFHADIVLKLEKYAAEHSLKVPS